LSINDIAAADLSQQICSIVQDDAALLLGLLLTDALHLIRPTRLIPEKIREGLERVKGIEPSYAAWEAAVLPLNYTRGATAGSLYEFAVDRATPLPLV